MLDEKEWSNCIGCFFYCSTLVFVLSRLVVVRIAMSLLNEKSQLYQVDILILVRISRRGPTMHMSPRVRSNY